MTRMTWDDALVYLTRIKDNGAGFWHRNSDDTITIYVRGTQRNDPNQWRNARQIEDLFGIMVCQGVTPDRLSGHLTLKLRSFKAYLR